MRVLEVSERYGWPTQIPGTSPATRHRRDVAVVTIDGSLRAPVGPRLREGIETLIERGARTIVLDLARVAAMDAAGVGELVRAYNTTRAAGGRLRIAEVPLRVRALLDLSRLSGVLVAETPVLGS